MTARRTPGSTAASAGMIAPTRSPRIVSCGTSPGHRPPPGKSAPDPPGPPGWSIDDGKIILIVQISIIIVICIGIVSDSIIICILPCDRQILRNRWSHRAIERDRFVFLSIEVPLSWICNPRARFVTIVIHSYYSEYHTVQMAKVLIIV